MYEYSVLLVMFKIHYGNAPQCLLSLFKYATDDHSL